MRSYRQKIDSILILIKNIYSKGSDTPPSATRQTCQHTPFNHLQCLQGITTPTTTATTFNGRLARPSSGKTFQRFALSVAKGTFSSGTQARKRQTFLFSSLSLSLSQLFFFPSCSYVFFFLLLLFFYVGFIRAKFVLQFNDFALENCCAPMQATAWGGGAEWSSWREW